MIMIGTSTLQTMCQQRMVMSMSHFYIQQVLRQSSFCHVVLTYAGFQLARFTKKLKQLSVLAQQDTILLMRKSWMMSTVSFNNVSFCYWIFLHLRSLHLLQSSATFSNNIHKILLTFCSKFHWTFEWHSGRAQTCFIFTPCFSERQRSTL